MQIDNHCIKCGHWFNGHWLAIKDYLSPTCPKCGAHCYEHGQRVIFSHTDEDNDEHWNEQSKPSNEEENENED